MARSKSAARNAARKPRGPSTARTCAAPVSPFGVQLEHSRPSLYVRLSNLGAVNRLIRRHGSAQAARDALTARLRVAGPSGHLARHEHRHAFWMSVWMSLARRADAQAVSP
jgi:hypothetical protein